jgi:hypothetical protein
LSRPQELLQGDTKTIEDVHTLDSDNEDDEGEWMPDPIDADPCKYRRTFYIGTYANLRKCPASVKGTRFQEINKIFSQEIFSHLAGNFCHLIYWNTIYVF